jgi:hypothetical protein
LAKDAPAEELFLAYVFIQKRGKQYYDKLRYELQANYSKGSNTYYPTTTQQAVLMVLNTFPKVSSLTHLYPN